MAGRKRTRASRSKPDASGLPDVYGEMLAEAGAGAVAGPSTSSEPPPKRLKRPGEKKAPPRPPQEPNLDEEDEDEDIEFEDVALPAPTVQTMTRDSEDEESEEEEIEFEDIDFGAVQPDSETAQEPKKLTLNLSAHGPLTSTTKKGVDRRKPMTKEEKERRITIHRTHVLCLVHHSALRNRWCDDEQVQRSLKPLLTKKTIDYLNPGSHLTQFGRTESLKNGLQQAGSVFKAKFQITERGLRRPLWAEDPEHLAKYEPPSNTDSCVDRSEFRKAARKLQGSRDVGAQLYCALLRAAGVRARLVCSLQALSFAPGGPSLPKPKTSAKAVKAEKIRAQLAQYKPSEDASSSDLSKASPLRRLGHPNAAAYQLPSMPASPPTHRQPKETPIKIRESQYPVYWVEVLDVGHQKWQPVDPLVTHSMWKPRALEPPAVDRENCMSYVIAFDIDGTVRDVTRRYAKAYAAKTRRLRIESTVERGDRWWRKALKPFRRPVPTDLDQIEDTELQAVESREPMPRNVADFKDHPVFALERHLRRNEVLIPEAQPAGTVAAGSKAPLEKVYRRKDVRIARSRDKWYRAFGREVKPMEIPVKFLPRRANAKPGEYVDDGYGGDERDATGTPLFMEEQTELYRAPAVVNGRIPKNKFGNIDLYVPTMVPEGGVHIADEFDTAARAAYILGIDYAPALGGFQFKGRHGTAVMNGVVVACEHEEAVRAVMDGLHDMDAQTEQSKRSLAAVRMWRRFLTALRIRERVYAGVDPDERAEEERQVVGALEETAEDHDMSEGGGFIHDDAHIAAGGGGFIPDDADSAAVGGGFMVDQYDGISEGGGAYMAREEEEAVVGGGFLADEDDDASGGGFVPDEADVKDDTTEGMRVIDEDEVASKGDDGQPAVDDAAASASELERDGEELEDEASDVTEEYDMEEDEGGGGFLVE
ncbi:DNA repair protein [Colletotrichum karsti]|uniref:DNA repair protein n=1 Tax=Colletotrichum karsti TaxID=1095194 RepID=A0A9P6I3Z5_9PEZI|nr:DNA repair protein [Colletotrichum karsti]KAF9875973.1 DNA repair protein [Colletotrichum karsti]